MGYPGKNNAFSRRLMSAALAVLLVAAFVPFQAVVFGETTTGTTWYVDQATGSDGNAGTSAEPFETVYAAVDAAGDGDTILVRPGHYYINEGRLVVDGFSNLRIASTGGADVTTLCGDDENGVLAVVVSEGIVIEGFTIHYGDDEDGAGIFFGGAGAKVKDCVIADNYSWQGAGVFSVESTIVVEGCEFSRNYAEGYGSGISAEDSKVTISDCEFTENGESHWDRGVYTWYAGAADLYDSDVTISGTTFADNIAESAGAVGAWGCDLTVSESIFKDNYVEWSDDFFFDGPLLGPAEAAERFDIDPSRTWASDARTADIGALQGGEPERLSGGGIGLYMGEYDISGTQFVENYADEAGGGVFAGYMASTHVSDCTFDQNDAFMGGGVFFTDSRVDDALFEAESLEEAAAICASGDVSGLPEMPEMAFDVERSVFTGNSSYAASAIFVDTEFIPASITNTLFEGNDSWITGVVVVLPEYMLRPNNAAGELEPMRLAMANCTFADNTAGLSMSLAVAGPADVRNTVFWGNTDSGAETEEAPFDAADAGFMGEVEFSFCDFEYGYASQDIAPSIAGTGNFSADPMFASDFNLTSGSPCVDTGTEEGAPDDDITGWSRPMDGDNDGMRAWDVGAFEYFDNLVRDVGMNRYATAVKACQQHFDSADTVIVATGEVFADGLSAAGLAGSYEAPILLSPHASMPALVKAEIKRLGATHAVVIGGENALSSAVMGDLKAMGLSVERIGGVNRYSTAAMIAVKIAAREGADFSGVGFVARGDTFPDALSVSPIAYAMKSPILLVKPTSMPQATVDVIEAVDFDEFMVAGGPDAVSSMAVGALAADTTQIGGLDRYDTSAKVSDYAVEKGWAEMSYTGIATGENFPDALTGGAALGSENGVLLLTPYKALHSSPKFLMEKRADEVKRVEVLGGTAAVSDTVWNSIAAILN